MAGQEKQAEVVQGVTDYIIIGSGIAGLYTALKLSRCGRVSVFCKKSALESNTWFAQGGIAAVFGERDSAEQHFNDTMIAGADFGNPDAVRVMVEEGPLCINDLQDMGVKFDRRGEEFALGKEGAHSRSRILRIGGDATGRFLVQSLHRIACNNKNITFHEDAFILHLLTDKGFCKGVRWYESGKVSECYGKAVVLASGGGGYLFRHTTNPEMATADGAALAYDAGAEVSDLEFVQFHPTVFFKDDKAFLISEAVRGEGAHLVNINEERFMFNYHEAGELGPRDVLARALIQEKMKTNGNVCLDLRHLGGDFIKKRFPTIYRTCYEWGLDITKELTPVCPAAHYFIGGIKVDPEGKTGVEGLYAVGEAALTGVHGANRLASNSLLEALVFSRRAARYISRNSGHAGQAKNAEFTWYEPCREESEQSFNYKNSLRELMWDKVGLFRSEKTLEEAVSQIDEWINFWHLDTYNPHVRELQNMLLISRMIAGAALHRRESRGCHFREDYPERSAEGKYHLVFQKKHGIEGVKKRC